MLKDEQINAFFDPLENAKAVWVNLFVITTILYKSALEIESGKASVTRRNALFQCTTHP